MIPGSGLAIVSSTVSAEAAVQTLGLKLNYSVLIAVFKMYQMIKKKAYESCPVLKHCMTKIKRNKTLPGRI